MTTLKVRVKDSIRVKDAVSFIKKVTGAFWRLFDKETSEDEKVEKEDKNREDSTRSPPPLGIHIEEKIGTKEVFG